MNQRDTVFAKYAIPEGDIMKVIIDRFEGDYAVVEIEEGKFVNMPAILLPNAKEGDVVIIEISEGDTNQRKKNLEKRLKKLFKD